MTRHVALIRAVNLGPHRRIEMSALRAALADAGHGEVRTHLQSGNVLLTSAAAPDELAAALERTIAAELGVEARVVVRTRDELADVVARDPLGAVASDPRRYQVSFLSAEPAPERLQPLAAAAAPEERFVVAGREIYAWHPDGIHSSKLARALSDRVLGVTATARNWNTVRKLLEMASAGS